MDEIRAGVRKSIPEIQEIKDKDLQDKVVEAWAVALAETEYSSLDDMSGAADVDSAPLGGVSSQATHISAVAKMSMALADAFDATVGPLPLNRDHLLATAILHDVGKPYEWSERNRKRWRSDIPTYGYPGMRHAAYGAHLALIVGLPEDIAHGIANHCFEGNGVSRNLASTIVKMCDYGFWDIASRAGMLGEQIAGAFTRFAGTPEI